MYMHILRVYVCARECECVGVCMYVRVCDVHTHLVTYICTTRNHGIGAAKVALSPESLSFLKKA